MYLWRSVKHLKLRVRHLQLKGREPFPCQVVSACCCSHFVCVTSSHRQTTCGVSPQSRYLKLQVRLHYFHSHRIEASCRSHSATVSTYYLDSYGNNELNLSQTVTEGSLTCS
jgi:hypothetical protein